MHNPARCVQIRTNTAEYLYLILQSKDVGGDTDEAEGVILETEWLVAQPFLRIVAHAHPDASCTVVGPPPTPLPYTRLPYNARSF